MQYKKVKEGYLVRLDRGEEIVATLTDLVRKESIPSGFITGIGAVERASIGVYDPHAGSFVTKSFGDRLELGGLTGNISYNEESGEPLVHCHITVGDSSHRSYTGHLFEAIVLITVEIFIFTVGEKLIRRKDGESGLSHWHL